MHIAQYNTKLFIIIFIKNQKHPYLYSYRVIIKSSYIHRNECIISSIKMLKKACKMVYIGKKSQIMRIIYKHVLIKKLGRIIMILSIV